MRQNRIRFEKERNDRILAQQMEGAKLRAERMVRNQLREQAWEEARRQPKPTIQTPPSVQHNSPAFDRSVANDRAKEEEARRTAFMERRARAEQHGSQQEQQREQTGRQQDQTKRERER